MVDDPERGIALGATEYLTKPVNRHRLARILDRYACSASTCPVLIVEDDESVRTSMRVLLENNDCRVAEAENGAIALTLMEEETPALIFLDLRMELMDGFEFVERVRMHAEWRSIPIVVVTAHDLTTAERKRLNGNVEMILHKSGRSMSEFLTQVSDALRNSASSRLTLV
jgi:CheY-like chemotaxis protein